MRKPRITKYGPGRILRVWRAERDLTIADAAQLFRLSASQWSLIEAGKRNASPELAVKLAAATSAQIEYFLGIKVTR